MKEFSIEDKAKHYDKVIERAIKHRNKDGLTLEQYETIDIILPELKESEDEKIREWLINLVKSHIEWLEDRIKEQLSNGQVYGKELNEAKDALAWLEKQGETNKEFYEIAEKEKREFVGDGFIKCYANFQDFKEGETYWLEYIGNDNYNVRSDNLLGKTYHITPCQLYTIFKKMTWLERQDEQSKSGVQGDYRETLFKIATVLSQHEDREGSPLEQIRSIMIDGSLSAMDLEDKELKKIEQKPTDNDIKETLRTEYEKGRADAIAEMQKPAWSKEDEIWVDRACMLLDELNHLSTLTLAKIPSNVNDIISHLKSIKERYTWKPSRGQIEAIEDAIEFLGCTKEVRDDLKSLYEQLKKLNDE